MVATFTQVRSLGINLFSLYDDIPSSRPSHKLCVSTFDRARYSTVLPRDTFSGTEGGVSWNGFLSQFECVYHRFILIYKIQQRISLSETNGKIWDYVHQQHYHASQPGSSSTTLPSQSGLICHNKVYAWQPQVCLYCTIVGFVVILVLLVGSSQVSNLWYVYLPHAQTSY